jgi:hypothetical protein
MKHERASHRRIVPDHHDRRAPDGQSFSISLRLAGIQRIKIYPAFPSGDDLPTLVQEQVRVKS